jgi:hypothetical protein
MMTLPERILKWRCSILLVSLFAFMGIFPFLKEVPGGNWSSALTVTLIILTATVAAYGHGKHFVYVLCLGFIALILEWICVASDSLTLKFWSDVSNIILWVYVISLLLQYVLSPGPVTVDEISGSISIYLLLGIVWGLIHAAVETFFPGSYSNLEDPEHLRIDTLYFSFVTLTTLGYGDIAPLESRSKMLSILEATMGVMYLAVMIARLVGDYSRYRAEGRDE